MPQNPVTAASIPGPSPGQIIGSCYTCEAPAGQTSLGPLYRARRDDGQRVVLQGLRPQQVVPGEVLLRAGKDLQAAAALKHPGLVEISELVPDPGGIIYLVREHLEGETLLERVSRLGRPPVEPALDIIERAAAALALAHRRGLFHHRLSIERIFLERSGDRDVVRVLDLGLAPLLGHAVRGPTLLEARYLAPELGAGDKGSDARADVYALGALLFELLAGRPPFLAEDPALLLAQHAADTAPKLSDRAPDRLFSAELEGLLASMQAKAPLGRPQDAGFVLQRLRQLRQAGDLVITLDDREGKLGPQWPIAPPAAEPALPPEPTASPPRSTPQPARRRPTSPPRRPTTLQVPVREVVREAATHADHGIPPSSRPAIPPAPAARAVTQKVPMHTPEPAGPDPADPAAASFPPPLPRSGGANAATSPSAMLDALLLPSATGENEAVAAPRAGGVGQHVRSLLGAKAHIGKLQVSWALLGALVVLPAAAFGIFEVLSGPSEPPPRSSQRRVIAKAGAARPKPAIARVGVPKAGPPPAKAPSVKPPPLAAAAPARPKAPVATPPSAARVPIAEAPPQVLRPAADEKSTRPEKVDKPEKTVALAEPRVPKHHERSDPEERPNHEHHGASRETPAPVRPAPATPPAPAAPELVTVRIASLPSGAQVMREGQIVGTTPFSEAVQRNGKALHYQLLRAGYEPIRIDTVPDQNRQLRFELSPIMILK